MCMGLSFHGSIGNVMRSDQMSIYHNRIQGSCTKHALVTTWGVLETLKISV